jgi:hypothetical protein
MRKMLLVLTLAGATMIAPGMTPAAHAYGWFSAGAGFHVGPLSLSFVLGQPFAGYGPSYYYRSYEPISYPGYQCTDRCFVDQGVYYHDRGCPVVRHYLAQYQVDPYDTYVRYAPRYGSYYDGGYFERHGGYYGGGYGYYNGGGRGYYGGYANRGYYDRGYSNHGYSNRGYYGGQGYDRHDDGRQNYGRQGYDRHDYGRQNDGRQNYDRHDRRGDRGQRGGDHGQRGGDQGGHGGQGGQGRGGDHGNRGGNGGHGDHGNHGGGDHGDHHHP